MTRGWDLIVVGTGFGGSMVALSAVRAGLRVLLIERGRWVDRDDSAWDPRAILIDRKYRSASPFETPRYGFGRTRFYPDEAVGGKSVFYGAASFRLREADFRLRERFPDVCPESVDWPIDYAELAPFYDEAERLLGVAGVPGVDPTEPRRATGYGAAPPPFSAPARRVADAATALGLHPFPIPLAINFASTDGRQSCVQCLTCDLFPCKIGAKNDLAVTVLPAAVAGGATVMHSTVVVRLRLEEQRVAGVECVDVATGERFFEPCRVCVVAAGAIPSPALLLASGLGAVEPNGRWVGRSLMRHCSGIVVGLFGSRTNPERVFHKQIALTDFYFGDGTGRGPAGPWGMIQGLQVPPPEYIAEEGGFPLGSVGARSADRMVFLLCIAQDLPDPANRVEIDPARTDPYGAPIPRVFHRYTRRDRQARSALYREGARILRRAGALIRVRKPINTFSHAVGTCRFGHDPATAALDPWCRFFGVPNLYVVDASFLPSSGGVNPSLTIAANALRVGQHIVTAWGGEGGR
ncbi:MAG TPA: GMC family oxidoreductase [Gemmatimonadales bacterium]|jgi:choline dehydrogenase-like flavoprotein|nr:GMC family oxidoreductase [Gemmatimonadales bacterium]